MPVDSIAAARNAINQIIYTAWVSQVNYPEILFDAVHDDMPEGDTPWAHVRVFHLDSGESTLADSTGVKRFTSLGKAVVEIYTPQGKGRTVGDAHAKVIQDALRGKKTGPDKVVFRKVVVNEGDNLGSLTLTIVLADFEYDELN
jgi:hypothetical protein